MMRAATVRSRAAMANAPRIRLLLVDDHPLMRAGLANLLQTEPDFLVVAQAGDGETAIDLYGAHKPDVCLLDVTMHGIDGIETLSDGRAVLKVRVRAAPSEGEANDALCRLMAKSMGVPPRDVSLVASATARVKRLAISGDGPTLFAALEKICASR